MRCEWLQPGTNRCRGGMGAAFDFLIIGTVLACGLAGGDDDGVARFRFFHAYQAPAPAFRERMGTREKAFF